MSYEFICWYFYYKMWNNSLLFYLKSPFDKWHICVHFHPLQSWDVCKLVITGPILCYSVLRFMKHYANEPFSFMLRNIIHLNGGATSTCS